MNETFIKIKHFGKTLNKNALQLEYAVLLKCIYSIQMSAQIMVIGM